MKIYTKRGDQGQTDLLTKRIHKTDIQISVNGAFDEAMAFILMAKHDIEQKEIKEELNQVHDFIFSICHEIALDDENQTVIEQKMVEWVEQKIDYYDSKLEPLTKFIKLDQTRAASMINIVRVTIRRAERELVYLASKQVLNPHTLELVNRLSDYCFVLGRYLEKLK
jgi:cob(I)alamin adenosyltransferase